MKYSAWAFNKFKKKCCILKHINFQNKCINFKKLAG